LRWSGTSVSVTAVIAGIATTALIYLLSHGGAFSGGRLILISIGVGTILNAVVSYLLLRASQYDIPAAFHLMRRIFELNCAIMTDPVSHSPFVLPIGRRHTFNNVQSDSR
jgi:ABC-type Fe3+-siderophore transport system permease subunit